MKKIALIAISMIIAVSSIVWAQDQTKRLEGLKPYTPTRLEWFAVELNAENRVELTYITGYSLDFVSSEKTDTIIIWVRYLPNVDREIMNMNIETAKKLISIKAKRYGWSSWLKVEENVKMQKSKK